MEKIQDRLSARQIEYWRRNLRIIGILLSIWFVVTFIASWYARELNEFTLIGPAAYYIGAQGALIVYVILIVIYARHMNKLDQQCGI